VTPAQLPAAWRRCELLHLAPVMGEVELAAWLAAELDAGLVGIGIQGWIKEAGAGERVVQKRWDVDARALAGVGAACVGEEDLIDQGDLLDTLVRAVPVVALTHGKAGCDVIVKGKTTRVGIYPAKEVDPTGAGDVFAAGFLNGLARGLAPVEAARLGAAAASIAVEGRATDSLGQLGDAGRRAVHVPVEPAR
jgi:sugar/nucleoside kinase (ribokinase family)